MGSSQPPSTLSNQGVDCDRGVHCATLVGHPVLPWCAMCYPGVPCATLVCHPVPPCAGCVSAKAVADVGCDPMPPRSSPRSLQGWGAAPAGLGPKGTGPQDGCRPGPANRIGTSQSPTPVAASGHPALYLRKGGSRARTSQLDVRAAPAPAGPPHPPPLGGGSNWNEGRLEGYAPYVGWRVVGGWGSVGRWLEGYVPYKAPPCRPGLGRPVGARPRQGWVPGNGAQDGCRPGLGRPSRPS
jgi:hypothetical protein